MENIRLHEHLLTKTKIQINNKNMVMYAIAFMSHQQVFTLFSDKTSNIYISFAFH